MRGTGVLSAAIALAVVGGQADAQDAHAIAKAFGAREQIQQISLSPDGAKVAIVTPYGEHGEALMIADPTTGGVPATILKSKGDTERLRRCDWITNARLVCRIHSVVSEDKTLIGFTRMVALDTDGSAAKLLSAPATSRSFYNSQNGGSVIDWLGDGTGGVLMTRHFAEQFTTGSQATSSASGLGVERVDTVTLVRRAVETPRPMAVEYLTDGHGKVRIMGLRSGATDKLGNTVNYMYRQANGNGWLPLGKLQLDGTGGFDPYAVDASSNVAYGFDQHDGRKALYRVALDGSLKREVVLARPDVDVDELITIGRQHRVVGASYATERRQVEFFDPELRSLSTALERALPGHPAVSVVDASEGEKKLLVFAGGDTAPGSFYVLDRATRHLAEVLPVRPELAAIKLGMMKPISYIAADGTKIPAYLTLPAGSDGHDLPAIVMPHGGPSARDEWGFDWWAQFFAARGFAVLQPNFRGSSGYGSAWFAQNGFKSWRTAIGDVNDAGRWLIAQGIAKPGKLAIVGWSYGGYAALQSAVLNPSLFKAIIAVAPVTDLETLRNESVGFSNHDLTDAFIGHGAYVAEGSPARNASAIQAPVLMFHADRDQNVGIAESRLMARRLRDAGKTVQLVEYAGLDHQLDDSSVRTDMLTKSDAFLRQALGL